MAAPLKVLGSAAAAGAALVVAGLEALPPPENVWPVSVTGWVTLISVVVGLPALVVAAWRTVLKPLADRVEQLRAETKAAHDALRQRCEHDANTLHQSITAEINGYRQVTDQQMNGFGKRVEKLEDDRDSHDSIVNGMLQREAASVAHREHVGKSLERIEHSLDEARREHGEALSKILTALIERPRTGGSR